MSKGCKICDDIPTRIVIDEELAKGNSFAFIERVMKMRGFSVTGPTIAKHKRHQHDYLDPLNENAGVEVAPAGAPPPGVTKKDLATLLKDRMTKVIETMEDEDLVSKDMQPFIGNAIKTQATLDKREGRKQGTQTFALLLAGAIAERMGVPQIAGPVTIEGEAEEIE